MAEELSFAAVMAQARAGVRNEFTDILCRYIVSLREMARIHLSKRARQLVEDEDVVQSVLLSFISKRPRRIDVGDKRGLWPFLVENVLRHCGKWNKRVQRRRPVLALQPSPDETGAGFEPCDEQPSPGEAAALTELTEYVLRDLTKPQRMAMTLRLQGYTLAEVSERVPMTPRQVRYTETKVRESANRWYEHVRV